MRSATTAVLVFLLFARFDADAQDKKKGPEKKPLLVALTKIQIKKGMLRPGYDVKAEIPAQAYQGKIGTDLFWFVDLDGNDEIVPGTDGIAMPSAGPFVVPLSEGLLVKAGQFKLAFEGTKAVSLTQEDLGASQKYVPDASVYTELRLRAGLRTAVIDPKLSLDCDKHADYLKVNGLNTQDTKISSHLEDSSKPGYTPEGEAAGMGSVIFKEKPDLRRAITSWYSTPYHGSSMLLPTIEKIGLTTKNAVSMLYFGGAMPGGGDVYMHPPDGAIEIPTAFGNGEDGENPNPVPSLESPRGCGFPLIVMLHGKYTDMESAELVDGAGRPVKGYWSSPTKPANPTARPENKYCIFFIPAKPLAAKTVYKATIKFPGGDKPLTWSFTTGAK
jgi:hypothetical protein